MALKNQNPGAVCRGCGCLYLIEDKNNRLFCDFRCKECSRYKPRQAHFPALPVSAIPLGQRELRFRENLYARVPKGADGYALYCFELELSFPMMGLTRRYNGHKRAEPFFSLWPFEAPLVPLEAKYGLQWLNSGYVLPMTTSELETISVTFPQPMNHVILRQLISRWRRQGSLPASPELMRRLLSAGNSATPRSADPQPANPARSLAKPGKGPRLICMLGRAPVLVASPAILTAFGLSNPLDDRPRRA